MAISWDGNSAFVGDNIAEVRAYPLSTPWDISTAGAQSSIYNSGFSVGSLNISTDGLELITHQGGGGIVRQSTMTSPWDLDTATVTANATPIGPVSGTITGIAVSPDGHNIYVLSGNTGDIFQYFMKVDMITLRLLDSSDSRTSIRCHFGIGKITILSKDSGTTMASFDLWGKVDQHE